MDTTSETIYKKAKIFFKSQSQSQSQFKSNYSNKKCSCYTSSNNYAEYWINIPLIKNICGFNVSAFLSIESVSKNKTWIYSFVVTSKQIKTTNNNNLKLLICKKKFQYLTQTNIEIFIELIRKIMSQIYFNKSCGLFEIADLTFANTNKININAEFEHKSNNFSSNKINDDLDMCNKITKFSDCCVCYDKTINQTSCAHFLCLECWTKIKKISECPYCRTTGIFCKTKYLV